jgi:hypothetical protein
MATDVSLPERHFELLESRISAIEDRLARLEARELAAPARVEPAVASRPRDDTAVAGPDVPDVGSVVTLLGRTLFVFAGAFLLRALTDSGRLAAGPGVLLGLAFALTWVVWPSC